MSATDYTAPPPDWPAAMREARERVEAERDIGADWPDALPLPQSGDIGDGAADYPLDALPAALRAAAAEVAPHRGGQSRRAERRAPCRRWRRWSWRGCRDRRRRRARRTC